MKVFITGGAGFIGSHLADKLVEKNHKVVILDDLSGGTKKNISNQAVFVKIDCRDNKGMDKIFKKHKPEVVFHRAFNAAENKAQFSPIDITSRNYDAFIKTLTPFIKYKGKRFIFTSSVAVYGSLQIPFRETDKPEPEDLYGITKLAAEKTLEVMSKVYGFEYVIVRPHNVYGPRQNMRDPYRNVVTIWMNAILSNKPYYIYGDGSQTRCFTFAEDVVRALVRCFNGKVSGRIFNIGSDKKYSLNSLARHFSQFTNKKASYLPERPQEVKFAIPEHKLAKKYLNYRDKTSLREGLRLTWEWCKKQGPQEAIYGEIEIKSKKLPKNWI